jgi:hypothetical protein
MVEVVGSDDDGLELVRKLELYQEAGLANVKPLQTAGRHGRPGGRHCPEQSADILLRHVHTVFRDGYRLEGDALREASGLNGIPNRAIVTAPTRD